jgi:hypothetical protein
MFAQQVLGCYDDDLNHSDHNSLATGEGLCICIDKIQIWANDAAENLELRYFHENEASHGITLSDTRSKGNRARLAYNPTNKIWFYKRQASVTLFGISTERATPRLSTDNKHLEVDPHICTARVSVLYRLNDLVLSFKQPKTRTVFKEDKFPSRASIRLANKLANMDEVLTTSTTTTPRPNGNEVKGRR